MTSKIKLVLFDFDGVVTNSFILLKKVWNEVRTDYRYRAVTDEDLEIARTAGIGAYLHQLGVTGDTLKIMLPRLQANMATKIQDLPVVEGMTEALNTLNTNYQLGILSSNAKATIESYLRKNALEIFDFVYQDDTFFEKETLIQNILESNNLSTSEMIYVGDEVRDVISAHKVGVKVVAVTWGYNSRTLLEKEQPDWIIDSPVELVKILSN